MSQRPSWLALFALSVPFATIPALAGAGHDLVGGRRASPAAQAASPAPAEQVASPAPAPSPATASSALATSVRLRDIAWIAGQWIDDSQGNYSEEVWTGPAGGSMLGMWRLVSAGRPQVFELLTLTEEPEGVVLRLRHFDPRLVAREEKDSPVALRLVGLQGARATFEGPSPTGPLRLTYHRAAARTLAVTLEREGRKQEFRFEKKDAGPSPSPSLAP